MISKLNDREFMIKVLVATSILMFFSFITAIPKIIGLFLLIWVCSVFWNLKLHLSYGNVKVSDLFDYVNKSSDEAKKNKKYFRKTIYDITIPMIAIGLLMIILILIAFFTIL